MSARLVSQHCPVLRTLLWLVDWINPNCHQADRTFIDILYCNSSTQFCSSGRTFSLLFHASLLHFSTMMAWISRGPFISFRGNSTPLEIRINGVEECTLARLHEGGETSVKSNENSCQGPSSSLLLLLRFEARSAYFGGVCISYRMAGNIWIYSGNLIFFLTSAWWMQGKQNSSLRMGNTREKPRNMNILVTEI